jgi:hypothetical protein
MGMLKGRLLLWAIRSGLPITSLTKNMAYYHRQLETSNMKAIIKQTTILLPHLQN